MKRFKSLFIHKNFFYIVFSIILLYVIAFFYSALIFLINIFFLCLIFAAIFDIFILYFSSQGITAKRKTTEKLSNGDNNEIILQVWNFYQFAIYLEIIDELPFQFQKRDFFIKRKLASKETQEFIYIVRPVKRGEYSFGSLNVFVSSPLRLLTRKFIFAQDMLVPVYPSLIQLKKYDIFAISHRLKEIGIKKIRKIGTSTEFDQIKNYVQGDDIRKINWKATARKRELMVNHFRDERSQHVYSVIDMGRIMKMPFENMSLLDYAVNTSLVISNIAIRRDDKAGIVTFSNKVDNIVAADKKCSQIFTILETLYKSKTNFLESNYEELAAAIIRKLGQRSLILFFTNYDTLDSLKRNVKYLTMIAKKHFVVTIFFENTELQQLIDIKADSTDQIYTQAIAEKFVFEKKQIIKELRKYGIHSILTTPKNLTVDTINKYIELKARGIM